MPPGRYISVDHAEPCNPGLSLYVYNSALVRANDGLTRYDVVIAVDGEDTDLSTACIVDDGVQRLLTRQTDEGIYSVEGARPSSTLQAGMHGRLTFFRRMER